MPSDYCHARRPNAIFGVNLRRQAALSSQRHDKNGVRCLCSVASTCAVAFVVRRQSITLSSSLLKKPGSAAEAATPVNSTGFTPLAVEQLGNVYNRRLEIEIRGEQHWLSLVGVALVMRSIVRGNFAGRAYAATSFGTGIRL